ncbi:hypothetical protein [Allocoleopsis franciscana]|nr:hypothetical protein [Allocoleopsis franciscana]
MNKANERSTSSWVERYFLGGLASIRVPLIREWRVGFKDLA